MVDPPVRGDNPRAFASGLSPAQVDKPWYNYFISLSWVYTFHITKHFVLKFAFSGQCGIKCFIFWPNRTHKQEMIFQRKVAAILLQSWVSDTFWASDSCPPPPPPLPFFLFFFFFWRCLFFFFFFVGVSEILLSWCYVARAAGSTLLRSWISCCAFSTIRVHGASTT